MCILPRLKKQLNPGEGKKGEKNKEQKMWKKQNAQNKMVQTNLNASVIKQMLTNMTDRMDFF